MFSFQGLAEKLITIFEVTGHEKEALLGFAKVVDNRQKTPSVMASAMKVRFHTVKMSATEAGAWAIFILALEDCPPTWYPGSEKVNGCRCSCCEFLREYEAY